MANLEINGKIEQRICINFCLKLGKTATETHQMLQQAFQNEALSRSKTLEWFSRYKAGTSFFDNERSGHPLSARNPENIELVLHPS